ncbi:hypothetical protein QYE76_064855 [Lolium multiflorum]|uniref:Uncharacterized protein n=1 Tax=Lolium multiflorum TaxID=4521 RepID=A0AAD8S860_LOLMU|nr:hypothetical protein QYE76_064855 [Lolium multiflorum]
MVWPLVAPDSALPPTNSLRDETPSTENHDTENLPETPPPPIPSRGIHEIASGTLPERGIISRRTLRRHGRLRCDVFHVGAGIPGVAPHYISPPSTFNVLLGSSWFDKPWFLSEGKLAAVRIIPSSWGCPTNMEPVNTKFYQLGNGGSLIFEHDLNALSDHLGRPHPEFHGSQIANQPGGELQWIITADLRGKMEPPTSERILFSFMESNWLDGLARALQEGLARLCGMSGEALKHPRFSHLARRNSAGEPMDMSSHPELKHHVEHLDFMLYHTQQDLDHSREYANQTHARIIEQGDAIKMLANDRRTLRQQRAKRDATITRLRAKIAALEATVKAQEEQMKKMEEDGEDIQGGSNYLSDDNDFEEDENTEGEDYDFLDDEDDDHTPIDVDEDEE